jgi:hypothetical protein
VTYIAMIVLAIWRITRLLGDPGEAGPWHVMDRIRLKIGVEYDEYSELVGTNEFARGAICVKCLSIWLGALFALLYAISPIAAFFVSLPFALSAGAIIIEGFMNGRI